MEPIVTSEDGPIQASSVPHAERASFGDRFFAALVDNVMLNIPLRLVFWFVIPFIASLTGPFSLVTSTLLYIGVPLVVQMWYFAAFAYKHNGQTLGKKWNKVKVVDMQGNDLTLGHFMKREFIARGMIIVCILLIGNWGNLWVLTYLWALSSDKLALHDRIAKTQVIKVS